MYPSTIALKNLLWCLMHLLPKKTYRVDELSALAKDIFLKKFRHEHKCLGTFNVVSDVFDAVRLCKNQIAREIIAAILYWYNSSDAYADWFHSYGIVIIRFLVEEKINDADYHEIITLMVNDEKIRPMLNDEKHRVFIAILLDAPLRKYYGSIIKGMFIKAIQTPIKKETETIDHMYRDFYSEKHHTLGQIIDLKLYQVTCPYHHAIMDIFVKQYKDLYPYLGRYKLIPLLLRMFNVLETHRGFVADKLTTKTLVEYVEDHNFYELIEIPMNDALSELIY